MDGTDEAGCLKTHGRRYGGNRGISGFTQTVTDGLVARVSCRRRLHRREQSLIDFLRISDDDESVVPEIFLSNALQVGDGGPLSPDR